MHRLTRFVLGAPIASSALLLVATVFFVAGATRVQREFGYRTLLGPDYPAIVSLETFVQRYSGGFPVYIVWSCGEAQPCRSVFDQSSLRMARSLEDRLRIAAGVQDVRSPASASLIVPTEDGFRVRRFFEGDEPVSDSKQLADRALQDALWVGNLVSADGSVGALIVLLTDSESQTMEHVIDAIEVALDPFRDRGFEFHLAGHPVASVVAGRELAESTASLVPFTALVIALVLLGLTRSVQATLVTMVTMGIGLLWTLGFLGWLQWPQDSVLQVLAPLILIVGVCDAVHVLSRYSVGLRHPAGRPERAEAILGAAREVASPCLLTTLTTAGAFLSFVTSDLDTFVRFGSVCAFGVTACLLLTFSLLPLLVMWLPVRGVRPARELEAWRTVAGAIVQTAQDRRVPILVAAAGLCVVCAFGWAAYLRVDTQPEEMFGEQSRVTRSDRFVGAHLRGSDSLEIDVALPPGSLLPSPETQAVLTRFTDFLRETEGLGRSISAQDLMGRLNRALHDDDPRFEQPSGSTEGNAEILELLALDDRSTLEAWTTLDASHARISVEGLASTSVDRGRVLEQVRGYVDREIPPGWSVSLTGPFSLSYEWVSALQSTQLRSFATAFLLVFVLAAAFLRSPALGLAAMVPAVLPVVVILGVMGFAGMSLDVGRVMIAAVVIGIAVDDAIHLLGRYRRERASGHPPGVAIRESLLFVVRPVVLTSAALALGFFTLTSSAWQTISSFGFLVSLSILVALAATLFVLPAVFFVLEKKSETPSIQRDASGSPRSQPGKILPTLIVLLLPVATVGGVATESATQRTSNEIDCWVLPNGRVMARLGSGCPLRSHDQLRSVRAAGRVFVPGEAVRPLGAALARAGSTLEIRVLRSGEERSVELPIRRIPTKTRAARVGSALLIAALLLSIPLVVLWHSSSPAAVPLALLYSSFSTLAVVVLCRPGSLWLLRAAVCAALAAPAILVHLALTFPRERNLLRTVPSVAVIPYATCATLVPAGWVALERNAALWPTFVFVLEALTCGAWLVLAASCAFASRESAVPLERNRARLLLLGTLFLPALPMIAVIGSGGSGAVTAFLAGAATLTPMPVALAISGYNLFDLGDDVRRAVARLLYVATGSIVLTGVLRLTEVASASDLTVLFALCCVAILVIEWARGRVLGLLESLISPRARELRDFSATYVEEIGQLRDEEYVAALLGRTLRAALRPRALAVFLRQNDHWRLAHAEGEDAPRDPRLACEAASFLAARSFFHMAQVTDGESRRFAQLRDDKIEFVVALGRAKEIQGLVLLAESLRGRVYGALERDYAVRAAQQATLALLNARLAAELVAKERQAATGRTALGLFHEARKGLDWISGLSKRLGRRLEDPEATRDLRDIRDLSVALIESLQTFVRDATQDVPSRPGHLACDQLIDHAVGALEREHGVERIVQTIAPKLRPAVIPREIERALVNLLDNALLASPEDVPVHLSATLDHDAIQISVTDRGHGMEPETLVNCFEAGFSTRGALGGSGIGLVVAQQLIESVGGTIDVESRPGRGTRAILRLPVAGGTPSGRNA